MYTMGPVLLLHYWSFITKICSLMFNALYALQGAMAFITPSLTIQSETIYMPKNPADIVVHEVDAAIQP